MGRTAPSQGSRSSTPRGKRRFLYSYHSESFIWGYQNKTKDFSGVIFIFTGYHLTFIRQRVFFFYLAFRSASFSVKNKDYLKLQLKGPRLCHMPTGASNAEMLHSEYDAKTQKMPAHQLVSDATMRCLLTGRGKPKIENGQTTSTRRHRLEDSVDSAGS